MIGVVILEEQALSLDKRTRGRLASTLLRSLRKSSTDSEKEWEQAWADESDRLGGRQFPVVAETLAAEKLGSGFEGEIVTRLNFFL